MVLEAVRPTKQNVEAKPTHNGRDQRHGYARMGGLNPDQLRELADRRETRGDPNYRGDKRIMVNGHYVDEGESYKGQLGVSVNGL